MLTESKSCIDLDVSCSCTSVKGLNTNIFVSALYKGVGLQVQTTKSVYTII